MFEDLIIRLRYGLPVLLITWRNSPVTDLLIYLGIALLVVPEFYNRLYKPINL